MYTIAEKEGYFVAFDEHHAGDLNVYVDGSFNGAYGQMKRRIHVAAGWAIAGKNETLVGYGLSTFKAKFTTSSEKNELRSMLAFLDVMQEEFPEKINRNQTVTLIGDNKSLIVGLTRSAEDEKTSRRFYATHGDDYLRLLYYMSVMNLKFKWVKGHNANRFNCLADSMARKAFRAMAADGIFPANVRRRYVETVLGNFGSFSGAKLTSSQLRNAISRKGTNILNEIPTLWVGVRKVEHNGRTFAGFAYTDGQLVTKGARGGVFLTNHNDLYLTVRAVNYALTQYAKNGKKHKTLLVRVENEEASSLLTALGRGRKFNIARKDVALQHEVDKMRTLLKEQYVISLNNSDFSKVYSRYAMMNKSKEHASSTAYKAAADLIVAHA
jgi:ribonuclease HI